MLRAIELGKNSDLELRILGLGTVRHLVINTRVKRPFYEQGGLSPVFMGVEVSSSLLPGGVLVVESHLPCLHPP